MIEPTIESFGIAVLVILVNLYEVVRRLANTKYHATLIALLIVLYHFLSVRVVEMAWNCRAITMPG